MSDSRPLTPIEAAFAVTHRKQFDWVASVRAHAVWIVAFLAVAASITSVFNGFALDDVHIIVENGRVHSLANLPHLFAETYWPPIEGASLYRPLTMVAFTIEWVIGRGSPLPFHIANILLYALGCVAFYRLVKVVVDTDPAILAAALFAVHPVHSEAVANSVGQAELLVALFVFLAMERYIRARRNGDISRRDVAAIVLLYLAGCLSKEHALILPGLLLTSEVVIRNEGETLAMRIRRVAPLICSMAVVAVAFLIVRTEVVGRLRVGGSNDILDGQTFLTRVFTMLNVMVDWVRLLVFPAHLSADYSYPRTQRATGPEITMLPGVLLIIAGVALAWKYRREKPVVTAAILWIAVTMAIPSNIIMVTGFVLAERTLFLASAAVSLLVAVAFFEIWNRRDSTRKATTDFLQLAVALMIVFGATRSATRNLVWKDNETLFTHTVEDVPLSYRAHWMLAEHYALTNRAQQGADEMMLAVALGPKNSFGLVRFGAEQLARGGMCSRAMPLFRRALTLSSKDAALRHDAGQCLRILGKVGDAVAVESGGPIP
jgi:hypothetical protein